MNPAPPRPRRPFALRVVDPQDQLEGIAPALMERAAKTCAPSDPVHRALLFASSTLARYGVTSCVPPSAHAPILTALDAAEAWAAQPSDPRAVRKARSDAFAAVVAAERRTADALRASFENFVHKPHTVIDEHADAVVVRYAVLAANYACGAALLTLDAVDAPRLSPRVPQQVAGAIAYRSAGLGPGRSGELRAAACEQAEWEKDREGAPGGHGGGALAIQLFHEFLGASWKDHSDAQRVYLGDFVEWALGPLMS
jgi:hypothetical protein